MALNVLAKAQAAKPDTLKIDTVSIGYGVKPAKLVTSAISTVKGENLDKGFRLNLGSALFGQLPGLIIQQGNSEPGVGTPSFYGRGTNTFGAGQRTGDQRGDQPLLIIDGFIAGGSGAGSSFMQLVPEEVESVTFLKDAAATAIYGSRAANGVVLVTTKTGKAGPLQVTFSTKQGFNQPQFIPRTLNSYDYANLYNEALANDALPPKYTQADLDAYQNGTDPFGHPNVDWYSQILRKATPVSSYNLNLTGGNSTMKYFVLLNGINNDGLYKKFGDINSTSTNADYNRYNFRSNVDVNVSRRLSVSFKIGGTVELKNNPFDYNTNSIFNLLAVLPPNAFPVYNANGSYGGSSTYGASGVNSNPLGNLLETGAYQTNSRTLQTSLKFTEQLDMLTPGLSVSGDISLNNYYSAGTRKSRNYSSFSFPVGATVPTGTFGTPSSTSLSGLENISQYRNFILQGFLDYKRSFDKHDFSAMAMIYTDNITLPGTTGNNTDPYKHNGGAGRIAYIYDTRYIAEVSAGITGSVDYAPGKQYGVFPAASIGWIVSNENFLKKSKSLTFLKLRGSYGLVGNDNTIGGRYQFTQTYANTGTSGSYPLGITSVNVAGYAESTLANPDVTWEKERSANIGVDATLFNKLDIMLDVFNRDRYDILLQPIGTLPQFFGVLGLYPYYNQGKSNSRGFEASVTYNSDIKRAFRYFISTNISYARSVVKFNAEPVLLNANLYFTGLPIGQQLRYKAIGFWTQDDINKRAANPGAYPAPLGVVLRAGDIKYQDIGGPAGVPDGIIDNNDQSATSSNTDIPKYTAGLHTGFSIKGFDLDLIFQARTGVLTYLGGNSTLVTGSYFSAFQNFGGAGPIALGRWTPETAETATYPRLSASNNNNNYLGSSFYERDGSFIKLRSAEIGYTIPLYITNKIKLKSARIFVEGTNLFSLDHIRYGDPEVLAGYPVLRTLALGAKIQL